MTAAEIIKAIAGVILIVGFIFVLVFNAVCSIDEYKKKKDKELKNK